MCDCYTVWPHPNLRSTLVLRGSRYPDFSYIRPPFSTVQWLHIEESNKSRGSANSRSWSIITILSLSVLCLFQDLVLEKRFSSRPVPRLISLTRQRNDSHISETSNGLVRDGKWFVQRLVILVWGFLWLGRLIWPSSKGERSLWLYCRLRGNFVGCTLGLKGWLLILQEIPPIPSIERLEDWWYCLSTKSLQLIGFDYGRKQSTHMWPCSFSSECFPAVMVPLQYSTFPWTIVKSIVEEDVFHRFDELPSQSRHGNNGMNDA